MKKCRTYKKVLLLLLMIPQVLFGQDLEWAHKLGGSFSDLNYGMCIDNNSDLILLGSALSRDLDPGAGITILPVVGSTDKFFAKYDRYGGFIWGKSIYSNSISPGEVTVDGNDNIHIAGNYGGTTNDFDPGPSTFSLPSSTTNMFFAKYTGNGDFVLAKQLSCTNSSTLTDIKTDSHGNIYLTGFFLGTLDIDPSIGVFNLVANGGATNTAFLAKYDSIGNILWGGTLISSYHTQSSEILIDGNDDVLLTGNFRGITDFAFGASINNLTAPNSFYNAFISKYDSAGNNIWAKSLYSTSNNYGVTLHVDENENLILAGYYAGTSPDFNPGSPIVNLPVYGGNDIYVGRYSPNGTFLNVYSIAGPYSDFLFDMQTDTAGNIYLYGTFDGSLDTDPSADTNLIIEAGNNAGFLMRLNNDGTHRWSFPLASSTDVYPINLAINDSGSVFIAGHFKNSVDFDPGTSVFNLTCSDIWQDIYFARYNNCYDVSSSSIVGDLNICIGKEYVYVAEPVPYTTNYVWDFPSNWNVIVDGDSISVVADSLDGVISVYPENQCSAGIVNSVNVNIHIPPMNELDYFICEGDSIFLGGNFQKTNGSYYDTVPGLYSCDSILKSNLIVNSLPTAQISGPSEICSNETAFLSGSGGVNYHWSGPCGLIWNSQNISIPGAVLLLCNCNYILEAEDPNGCKNFDTICINAIQTPEVDAGFDQAICLGESAQLNVESDFPVVWFPSQFLSDTNVLNPDTQPDSTITYFVTSVNSGCSMTDSVSISVNPVPLVELTLNLNDTVCLQSGVYNLSGGTPFGGNYFGSGILSGSFDPFWAGIGQHLIYYSIIDINQCSATDSAFVYVDACLGTDEIIADDKIRLFPNPASDFISIVHGWGIKNIEIRNGIGELVLNFIPELNLTNIPIQNLPLGVYFVVINIEQSLPVVKSFVHE